MVLARNTCRFSLLLVGYGIASGIDDLGADSAEGPALLGLGLGGVALLAGTVAHCAGGSPGGSRDDGADGDDRTAGDGPNGPDGRNADVEADDEDEPAVRSGVHVPWGRY